MKGIISFICTVLSVMFLIVGFICYVVAGVFNALGMTRIANRICKVTDWIGDRIP